MGRRATGTWKPTQQEGLWFTGGNLPPVTPLFQFISLQLKARMEGIATRSTVFRRSII